MGLDPDYKLMHFVKSQIQKTLHLRFGKDLIKLPVRDWLLCFWQSYAWNTMYTIYDHVENK